MLQPNKYYVPTLDEFREGFRYEVLNADSVWMAHTYRLNSYLPQDLLNLRVKYLNTSDIQSLGFNINVERVDYVSYYKSYSLEDRNVVLYLTQIEGLPYIDLLKELPDNNTFLINNLHVKNINELEWLINRYGI